MKLKTGHTVAQINQTCASVLLDNARPLFQRFKNDDARALAFGHVLHLVEIEVEALALLRLVKLGRARFEHPLDVGGNALPFGAHALHALLQAYGIPGLEDSK